MDFQKFIELIEDAKLAFSKINYYKHLLSQDLIKKYAKLITNDILYIPRGLVLKCMMRIKKNILKLNSSLMKYDYLLENIYELSILFADITTDLSFVSGAIHVECNEYIEHSEFFDDNYNFVLSSNRHLTNNDKKMIQLVIFEWRLDFIHNYCFELYNILEKIKNIDEYEKMITIFYYHYRKQDSINLCKNIKDELFQITYEYDYMMKHILSEYEKNEIKNNFNKF